MSAPRLRRIEPPPDPHEQWMTADGVRSRKIEWLMPRRLALGTLAVLEGDPGAGKSTWMAGLAASITTGARWCGRKKSTPAGVIWLAGEEDVATVVRPRLQAAGANLARIVLPGLGDGGLTRRVILPDHFMALQQAIACFSVKLVILDPMVTYLAPSIDLNGERGMRDVLDAIARLAMGTNCTWLLTRHLRKHRSGRRGTHGLGSAAILATARSVLLVEHPDQQRLTRRLIVVKPYGSGPVAPATFGLAADGPAPTVVDWDESEKTDDDDEGEDPAEHDARRDAEKLLWELLRTGPVSVTEILREATAASIGERTLRAAKRRLGIVSHRVGSVSPARWEWGPPEGGF